MNLLVSATSTARCPMSVNSECNLDSSAILGFSGPSVFWNSGAAAVAGVRVSNQAPLRV